MSDTIKIKPKWHDDPVLTLHEARTVEGGWWGRLIPEDNERSFSAHVWELVPPPFEFPTGRGAVIGERGTDNLWVRCNDSFWMLTSTGMLWPEGDITTTTGNPDLYVLYPGEEVAE